MAACDRCGRRHCRNNHPQTTTNRASSLVRRPTYSRSPPSTQQSRRSFSDVADVADQPVPKKHVCLKNMCPVHCNPPSNVTSKETRKHKSKKKKKKEKEKSVVVRSERTVARKERKRGFMENTAVADDTQSQQVQSSELTGSSPHAVLYTSRKHSLSSNVLSQTKSLSRSLYSRDNPSTSVRAETISAPSMHTELNPPMEDHECTRLTNDECFQIYSKIFSLLNAHRANSEAAKLQWNRTVAQVAWKHARSMYKAGRTYVPSPCSNAISVDVAGLSLNDIGKAVFEQQIQSAGHEREMINPFKLYCGVGVYGDSCRIYVVQIFS